MTTLANRLHEAARCHSARPIAGNRSMASTQSVSKWLLIGRAYALNDLLLRIWQVKREQSSFSWYALGLIQQ